MPESVNIWAAISANLEKLSDARIWHEVCFGLIDYKIDPEDASFFATAKALLPEGDWDETTWSSWTGAIKQETGRKGKALFMPLRLVLSGLDHGPELKHLLPLMGREKVLSRLP